MPDELTRDQAAALIDKYLYRKPPEPTVIRADSGCSYGTYESVEKAQSEPSPSFLIGRKYGPEDKRGQEYYGWNKMGLVSTVSEVFAKDATVPDECAEAKNYALSAGPPPGRSIPLIVKWRVGPSSKAISMGFVAKPDGSAEASLTELGPIHVTGLLPRGPGTIVAEYYYTIIRSALGRKAGLQSGSEDFVGIGGRGKLMILKYDDGWRINPDAIL